MTSVIRVYLKSYTKTEEKEAKVQHRLGRELLKQGLIKDFGISYDQDMIFIKEHGKPELREGNLHFNISHCKGMVACGISDVPLGLDVETKRSISENLILKACSQSEQEYIKAGDQKQRFLECWTLKESYLKMTGEGLGLSPGSVNFQFVSWKDLETKGFRGPEDICCSKEGHFYQRKLKQDFILAVCAKEEFPAPEFIYC